LIVKTIHSYSGSFLLIWDMKFYTSHQIALHSAIADHGFEKTEFSFSKKKGRIIATNNRIGATFSFIERRESKLDPVKMRIADEFQYEISINGEKAELYPSWDALLEEFKKLLKAIL